ncbi:hypothetical protein MKZ38_000752 [Zalerion maritima]|uniref:Cysteine protease n=1 Tax=Zalerion maritima TaxID=339359 RepID=A0AAD5WTQ0_9PEZI|nr:hypothetical protein MKZ38_000752 [Zalerion maritima]
MDQAFNAIDPGRLRNVVQMFWDPLPSNDTTRNLPTWVLGKSYKLGPRAITTTTTTTTATTTISGSDGSSRSTPKPPEKAQEPQQQQPLLEDRQHAQPPAESTTGHHNPSSQEPPKVDTSKNDASDVEPTPPPSTTASTPAATASTAAQNTQQQTDTPPESVTSSFDSTLAYEEIPNCENGGWPPAFLEDLESRIWMTYRSDFELIPKSQDPDATKALSFTMRLKTQFSDQLGFSSDTGWGCMIRTGQCLLANTKLFLTMGRDWRRSQGGEGPLLSQFADDPRAPYSIHNFVRHGSVSCGKYPGEWFGPSATARCIQALANAHEPDLRVYSTGDGPDVYADTFMKMAKGENGEFHPTLILVSTRLGIDKITPVYWEALIAALQMKQSVGIAGGRPSSSLYFLGAQGQNLFYLDPHFTRVRLPYRDHPEEYTEEDIESCHTRRLRRIHVRDLDPSMLIGFLIRDEVDWEDWRKAVKHVQGKQVINVADYDPLVMGEGAIADVETLSDDEDTILDEE